MYATGQGVEKNSQTAVKWYTKAAEQGDVASQYNLGVMYAKGQGVEQSYQNAMKWYLKAAKKGDVKAQYNLGVMNYMGQGVKQNTMAAYLWWKLASLKGLQAASNRLSQLKKEMTPEQLIRAKEIDSTMAVSRIKEFHYIIFLGISNQPIPYCPINKFSLPNTDNSIGVRFSLFYYALNKQKTTVAIAPHR